MSTDIVKDFWSLTVSQRHRVACNLNLMDDSIEKLPEPERYNEVFHRAKERGLIGQLKRAIQVYME